ncbi:preprotein translocase subunit SecE [Salana multivorans]|uniref:Protein translocase subunit SecE n=1 Tax=Salana multivorans TaxID=120377 RepID=A0A3N2DBZ7_9MICO|nr:preprotein translocase subunit SecE [Salana multivorans]MBN8882560.1 preprotein translocase subunit SecE [Salana multivorans]OJX97732.1 MAG: preprotein translocase subunit SecE [Micrococcales bacterium 73-15]ROR97325.1 preprotein translocase subunit SecE [Salana multivorans]
MSETHATAPKPRKGEQRPSLFARIALFVRQVISELRKVVTPTRNELVNFTIVVVVFVLVCMAFVAGIDFIFGQLVLKVFGA